MAEVIARMRKEMQDRLKQIEGELRAVETLVAEKARLERALSMPLFATEKPATRKTTTSTQKRSPKRAPRGANRTAVYEAIRNMPGASSGEIAKSSGVQRAQVYNLLRAGVAADELVAVDLGGGRNGYRVAEQPETAFPAPEAPSE